MVVNTGVWRGSHGAIAPSGGKFLLTCIENQPKRQIVSSVELLFKMLRRAIENAKSFRPKGEKLFVLLWRERSICEIFSFNFVFGDHQIFEEFLPLILVKAFSFREIEDNLINFQLLSFTPFRKFLRMPLIVIKDLNHFCYPIWLVYHQHLNSHISSPHKCKFKC